ncbi:MAG: glycosyltransferase family 9 protein [Desulfobacteraceae bacterium]|nr:glycosyltransferase family 9 protein [Desulfobacteraceae bacterium]
MIRKGSSIISPHLKSVLLIQLGDIGDIVLSFPCAAAIRKNFPHAHITMAIRPKGGDLLSCCPHIDETVWIDDKKQPIARAALSQIRFFVKLRDKSFDLAIDLRTGTRGAILAFLTGAQRRIGFFSNGEPFWRNLLFTDLASPYEPKNTHISHYYTSLLSDFGIVISQTWPEMRVPQSVMHTIALRLMHIRANSGDRKLVVIQPFSLWRYKEWGDEKFADFISRLCTETHSFVIIVGSSAERERAEALAARASSFVANWAGQTSLAQLAALVAQASLFIGVDSAGMHIAAAVGTATVTIFGPSSAADWAPRGDIHTTVTPDWPCSPCFQKGCRDSGISDCLIRLPVQSVFEAVSRRLFGIK